MNKTVESIINMKEMLELKNCQQPKEYHPEGDAYIHSIMVYREAIKVAEQAKYPELFILAATIHDIGKAISKKYDENKGRFTYFGHDIDGLDPARIVLNRIGVTDEEHIEYVLSLVKYHMRPWTFFKDKSSNKSIKKILDKAAPIEDILLISKCDHLGRAFEKDLLEKEMEEFDSFFNKRLSKIRSMADR